MKKRARSSASREARASRRPAQGELVLQPTRRIEQIIVRERYRKDFGNLAELATSIDDRGALLHPIVITSDNVLLDGERRLRAWKVSRFRNDPIPVHVVSVDSRLAAEWDANAARKDWTPAEKVEIWRKLEAELAIKARERKLAGVPADPKHKGQAGDQAARVVGLDRKTLEHAAAIKDAAAADPIKFGPLLETMEKSGKVDGPFKRLKVLQLSAALVSEPPPLPMRGPYRTLVADVPWPGELDDDNPAERGRAYFPYATMSLRAIAEMGPAIRAICHPEGAWLWFWITNFHLGNGAHLPILEAWGFDRPSTILTWTKPHFGNGQRLRGQSEHCLLCQRGRAPYGVLTNQSTVLPGAASGEHSGKPAAFFELVETLTPAPRFAYLFAGRAIPDRWDGHGDRVGKVSLPAELAAPAIIEGARS
jgi:N6-adenosine-specific RNA methylase IME4